MALGNLNEIQNLLRSDPRLVVGGQTEIIIKYNGDIEKVARQVGAVVEILGDGYAIMTIGVDQIPGLLSFKEVEYLELPKTLTFE